MNGHEIRNEYYFVPLGRERGGLADFLQISPLSSPSEIEKVTGEYRLQLEKKFKQKRKELRQQRDEERISEEEFEEQVKELKKNVEDNKAKLNELKTKFDEQGAETREMAREGKVVHSFGWDPVFAYLDENALHELTQQRLPLFGIHPDFITAVEKRWVDGSNGYEYSHSSSELKTKNTLTDISKYRSLFFELPSELIIKNNECGPASLCGLLVERDILALLLADTLWSKLEGTNRPYWCNKINEWLRAIDDFGPKLNPKPVDKGSKGTSQHPALSGYTDVSIDYLQAEEIEDVGIKKPEKREANLLDLIKSLGDEIGDDDARQIARRLFEKLFEEHKSNE